MFHRLIASRPGPTGRQLERSGAVSLLAHLLVVGGAVWATIRPQTVARAAAPVVITWPDEPAPPGTDGVSLPMPTPPGNDGPVPVDLPADLARMDTRLPFDTASWRANSRAAGAVTTSPGGAGDVWTGPQVDEPPVLLAGRQPRYPEILRVAGVAGRVIVQAVIDTTGRAEPGSVALVESAHRGFDEPARAYILAARFRPGRVRGRPVRVLVRVPIEFALSRER